MRFALLLVLALTATGCVGREPAPTAGVEGASVAPPVIVDPATVLPGDAAAGDAPVWLLGDAWYITTTDGTDSGDSSVLAVTRVTNDMYTLSTTSESMAGFDAMFDVSYVGNIRARDLAGHQGGQAVQYFDFPLTDGKTWTTQWDGQDVSLTATQTPRGFDIVGTSDGEPFVSYDFAPALKWWSKVEFASGFGFAVQKLVSGWGGEIATATANVIFTSASDTPLLNRGVGTFTVSAGQTFAHVSLRGGGAMWARGFELIQPDGSVYVDWMSGNAEMSDAAASVGGYSYDEDIPATPGDWRIVGPTVHDPTGWSEVIVYEVLVTRVAFTP